MIAGIHKYKRIEVLDTNPLHSHEVMVSLINGTFERGTMRVVAPFRNKDGMKLRWKPRVCFGTSIVCKSQQTDTRDSGELYRELAS